MAIQHHSHTVLEALLFSQSKWAELLALPRSGGDSEDILTSAYCTCPEEEYIFSSNETTIPMTVSSTGSPLIEVKVNGSVKRFWVDTGAGLTVLASDVAEQCGVVPIGHQRADASTATTIRVSARPTRVSQLEIGGVLIKNHPAIILNKEDLEFRLFGFIRLMKIDGILGWNAIRNLSLEMDFRNERLTLRRSVRAEGDVGPLFWLGFPIVRLMSSDGTEIIFGIDTCARRTTIRPSILRKLGIYVVGSRRTIIGSAGGDGNDRREGAAETHIDSRCVNIDL
jgi:hypothetical protein